ncbi:Peptidylprolyl isomerase [Bertholletia excelsa]
MWRTPRFFQSTAQFHHHPPTPSIYPTHIQDLPTYPSPLSFRQQHLHCQFSRRELAIFSSSSLLLLGPQALDPFHSPKVRAEENPGYIDQNDGRGENVESIINPNPSPSPKTDGNDRQGKNAESTTNADPNPSPTSTSTNTTDGNDGQGDIAESINPNPGPSPTSCIDNTLTKKAFLDVAIDGQPVGRIVIGLHGNNAPAGVARFSDLVSGAAGITYRRKEFIKIMPTYVQHGGLRSYGIDAELAKQTGNSLAADSLKAEWEKMNEKCPGTKNVEGSVSIIVRDPTKPPPKLKLVAKNGKLQIDEEEVGKDPNGTEFVIAIKDSPELDASSLVIGRVLEGMEVARRIGQVKTVQENTGSPYFRVAKLIGDKRAVVAEKGFNRPYSRVVVSNCGLLE